MKIINGGPGFSAPMTVQEVKDFLFTSKLNIHFGTLDENGLPNIHPVWYYVDSSSNRLYSLVILMQVADPIEVELTNQIPLEGQRS
jgi:hypothetical protein